MENTYGTQNYTDQSGVLYRLRIVPPRLSQKYFDAFIKESEKLAVAIKNSLR